MKSETFPLNKFLWVAGAAVFIFVGLVIVSGSLHHPRIQIMTRKVIDRSELLEHRFAGVCMNCHLIRERGPVPINRWNMNTLNLNRDRRMLVMAGQRVDVPTWNDFIQAPALLREDLLPHTYVGVCSNCHTVLDIGPSREFMARGMMLARQELVDVKLGPWGIARATSPDPTESSEWLRNFWGFVALICLLIGAIYIVMRALIRRNPKKYAKMFKLKKWFLLHSWSSILLCLSVILHWYYSNEGNNFLHISLILILWLTFAGLVLQYRLVKGKVRKNVALLHSQQIIYVLLIILVIIGHIVTGID